MGFWSVSGLRFLEAPEKLVWGRWWDKLGDKVESTIGFSSDFCSNLGCNFFLVVWFEAIVSISEHLFFYLKQEELQPPNGKLFVYVKWENIWNIYNRGISVQWLLIIKSLLSIPASLFLRTYSNWGFLCHYVRALGPAFSVKCKRRLVLLLDLRDKIIHNRFLGKFS